MSSGCKFIAGAIVDSRFVRAGDTPLFRARFSTAAASSSAGYIERS